MSRRRALARLGRRSSFLGTATAACGCRRRRRWSKVEWLRLITALHHACLELHTRTEEARLISAACLILLALAEKLDLRLFRLAVVIKAMRNRLANMGLKDLGFMAGFSVEVDMERELQREGGDVWISNLRELWPEVS
ncbi:unnamed protein product [Victoria cruziana]